MVLSILCIYQSWGWNQSGVHMKDPCFLIWQSSEANCSRNFSKPGAPLSTIDQGDQSGHSHQTAAPMKPPPTRKTGLSLEILQITCCRCLRKGRAFWFIAKILKPETFHPPSWVLPTAVVFLLVFESLKFIEIPHLSTPKEVQALGEPEEWHRWPSSVFSPGILYKWWTKVNVLCPS